MCIRDRCKVVSGKAQMEDEYALSDEEQDEGFVLACITKPLTDEIMIDFDDV